MIKFLTTPQRPHAGFLPASLHATALALLLASLAIVAGGSGPAKAAIIASDNVENYTNGATIIGVNGGTGFAAWTETGSGLAIRGGSNFDVGSSTSSIYQASRAFATPLISGDVFSIASFLQGTPPATGKFVELVLADGANPILTLYRGDIGLGLKTSWWFIDNVGTIDTGVTSTGGAFAFSLLSSTQYSFTFDGYSSETRSFSGTVTGFWVESGDTTGAGVGPPATFNGLQVESVPEPSTSALLIAGGLAAAGVAIRRRGGRATTANA